MAAGYRIWVLASRSCASKILGTAVSSYGSCQEECPGLIFYSLEDARSYQNKLDPALRDSFFVYSVVMNFESSNETEKSP